MPEIQECPTIHGVVIVTFDVHRDEARRGAFIETWRKEWTPGVPDMVQASWASRCRGTLAGLHYHRHQADFWDVHEGRALVALHDLREGSPTDGASFTIELGEQSRKGLYIPPGVAHGYYALTDIRISYLTDRYYDPNDELGVAWDDPEMAVPWPNATPILSTRDQANPLRAAIPAGLRPQMAESGGAPSSRRGGRDYLR